jgi:hypothetical protein
MVVTRLLQGGPRGAEVLEGQTYKELTAQLPELLREMVLSY